MKQTSFHSVKLKIKRTALLVVGLTLFQILAWAGPRSFQQAQAIAERQAALQGIVMDQQQVRQESNICRMVAVLQRQLPAIMFLTTEPTRDSPSFRAMKNCRRLWAIRLMATLRI